MGDIYFLSLVKPGVTISDWLSGTTTRVRAKSDWSNIVNVNYILLDGKDVKENVKNKFRDSVVNNDQRIGIYVGKNTMTVTVPTIFIGMESEIWVRKFRNYLYYAKSKWASIGDGLASLVYTTSAPYGSTELTDGTSSITEVGGSLAFNIKKPEGIGRWEGCRYTRTKVKIGGFTIDRDRFNITLKSLALEVFTK